jgi:hypothetical protein
MSAIRYFCSVSALVIGNNDPFLPFELCLNGFSTAMQDVHGILHDVNVGLVEQGRPDDMLRQAIIFGISSEKHSEPLTPNSYFNAHPALAG